ncbi:outer membrane beta-barrel protein [Lacibacter sediminis]|uniref:PorT family protein n=1 Tax=Lacibacter sediminis TaxID=2760713 RepID=A0A7G5XD02_9BACT|nr:outer membrane beta-barrel protein [Lacibacter sediminis]QNA43355.1 PorT family protein [Lacibacter sediminis]
MKQFLIIALLSISSFAAHAQNKKITQAVDTQRASTDYLLKLGGVEGESSDSLPPAPNLLTVSAGGTMSQTHNTNLLSRYKMEQKPGYLLGIGYARELERARVQVQATYFKGGVRVASGDINGDGKSDYSELDLNYISLPVQFQIYVGARKRFFVGVGVEASYLLSKKQTGRPLHGQIKVFDGATGASAGVWFTRNVMLQAGYRYGLVDIDLDEQNKARNGMAFLTLSYAFYSKIKYGPVITIKPKG